MDTNLLRSWLGLPPGPWPPDDRAALGLGPGPVDPAEAERRALERMGRLRPHQLVHPELVTEGMNRLAQALLAVTATAAAAPREVVYDGRQEPPSPASPPTAPAKPPSAPREVTYDGRLEPPTPAGAVAQDERPIAEPEPVLLLEPKAAPWSVPHVAPPAPPRPEPIPIAVPIPGELPAAAVGPDPADRRRAYRELAALRGLRRAWDKLRPSLADPSQAVATAGDVYEFLDGVLAVRDAVTHPGLQTGYLREVAPLAASLLRQPLALSVFRSLLPSQRQALARDWARARAGFAARSVALREALARSVPSQKRVTFVGLAGTIARNPEWVLAMATVLVFAAAAVRLLARRD